MHEWLKQKYLDRKPWGRYRSSYGGNNSAAKPKHTKSDKEKALIAAQQSVTHMMVILPSGKRRMVVVK